MAPQVVNPLQYPGWDKLILTHSDHSIFHTTGWAAVLINSYGFTPQYLLEIERGNIVLLIPVMEIRNLGKGTRGVSLPFSDYCDPLLSEKVGIQGALGIAIAHGKKRRWTSLEIRTKKEVPKDIFPYDCVLHHELDITGGAETLFSRLHDSNRRNINKAKKEGVEIKFQTSLEAVKKFYTLHCYTRKEHGLPPQPFLFFRNLQKYILSNGNGFVALVFHQGKSIAGGIYMHYGEKAIFKYGASDKKYNNLRPNNMVMWEAIRFYSQNKFQSFSFGKTDPKNKGLTNYKRGWGSNENTIANIKYNLQLGNYNNKKNLTYGFHNNLFSYLPISISKLLGRIVYKYLD